MKVGTDGVLLGAWTVTSEGPILDIGTGTGLIAIMLAQRTKTALIDAIEVEDAASVQAQDNIETCSWKNRISIHHLPIQKFEPTITYDLIISNPPFFLTTTIKLPQRSRLHSTGSWY